MIGWEDNVEASVDVVSGRTPAGRDPAAAGYDCSLACTLLRRSI